MVSNTVSSMEGTNMQRTCLYFDEPGPSNTESVIQAVSERLGSEGTKCDAVVVASTSGLTALKFARVLPGVKVVCVSEPPSYAEVSGKWPTLQERYAEGLKGFHAEIVNTAPYVFHSYVGEDDSPVRTSEKLLREFLITAFGNGFKAAVEAILMATSVGAVKPYQPVIGVGGLHRGADTAIVARSTFPNRVLSADPGKSFNVMEIIALPRSKSANARSRLS
jgi:hypothetical protein